MPSAPLGSLCIAVVLPLVAACADLSASSSRTMPADPARTIGTAARAADASLDGAGWHERALAAERYLNAMTALATERSAEARARAVGELRLAAEGGHAAAQHRLAEFYWVTALTAEDRARAVAWFERAAHQGDADAAFRLGHATLNGNGVKANGRRAAAWLRKASEDDVAEAQYMLGVIHLAGDGVERDPAEAERWFGRAADNGHPEAARALQALRGRAPVAAR